MGLTHSFFSTLQLYGSLFVFAVIISILVLLKLLISALTSTPRSTLYRDAKLFSWIGVPTTITYLYFGFGLFAHNAFATLPVVFAAIFSSFLIGNLLRPFVLYERSSPQPTSFPLATLVFTILFAVLFYFFVRYGFISPPENCETTESPFTWCSLYNYDGWYVSASTVLFTVVCGILMSPESNLISLYEHFIFNIRQPSSPPEIRPPHQPAPEVQPPPQPILNQSEPVQNLPAVIPPTPVVPTAMPPREGMALKFKRSQKAGFGGGITYMLDARMEASAEVLAHIRNHRLGSHLVYESATRQKHKDAAQDHLARSRNDTSLFAPPSVQAMGAAKTFWKLGRAAVSSVRSALALRITIDSLLKGVHVECKSMKELLEAEDAIKEAGQNLKTYVEVGKTFDGGEEVVEL